MLLFLIGEQNTLPFLPASFSLGRGPFEQKQRPLWALNLASYIASGTTKTQGHDQVCLTRAVVPGHRCSIR